MELRASHSVISPSLSSLFSALLNVPPDFDTNSLSLSLTCCIKCPMNAIGSELWVVDYQCKPPVEKHKDLIKR